MTKRVLIICILVVGAGLALRFAIERFAHGQDDRRSWHGGPGVVDRSPAPDLPPWIQESVETSPDGLGPTPSIPDWTPSLDPAQEGSASPPNALPGEEPLETLLAEDDGEVSGKEPAAGVLPHGEDTPEFPTHETATTAAEPEESSSIVINEIMFHPAAVGNREPIAQEYIELHNPGDEAIDLEGYQLTRGVRFTFPRVTLRPGDYLVVTPDKNTFRATYGSDAVVVGNWAGRLSNSAEEVRLVDEEGKIVDRVAYADQGYWARRARQNRTRASYRSSYPGRTTYFSGVSGWEWQCEADGQGPSFELVSVRLPNDRGTNWLPSQRRGGTPGAPNSLRSADAAPLISDVEHRPAIPKPHEKVVILAEIEDEEPSRIQAEVLWRVSDRRGRASFEVAPMKALADGRYAAVIPGREDKAVVEFYLRATDGKAHRLWPVNADESHRANALYQVDSEINQTSMAFYRLIMTEEENRSFPPGYRHSNAQSNTTLIADDGSGPVIRYLCGTRVRGAGSRNFTPPPMRVNLPRDRPWNGATRINLNSVYPWLQYVGMKLFQASRLAAPDMIPVQVRRNGRDIARGGMNYGAFVHAQPLDGAFAERHYAPDSAGNLYKKVPIRRSGPIAVGPGTGATSRPTAETVG